MKIPEMTDHTKEMLLLSSIFIFGCVMLALFPGREELARWIENGAVIGIIARGFGTAKPSDTEPPSGAQINKVVTTVEQTKKETP